MSAQIQFTRGVMRILNVICCSLVMLMGVASGNAATLVTATSVVTPSPTANTPLIPTQTLKLQSTELTVFAASSLTESFNEMATAFQAQHPDANVVFNFAGSQTLRTQLENGAQADIFASADQPNMDGIVAAGLNLGTPVLFATNLLTIITPTEGPGSDRVQTLAHLGEPGVKVVLAAPNVPVGRYARESLEKMNSDPDLGSDFSDRVLANVVSEEENVRLVAQKVVLGEADAGIVYQTDAAAPGIAPKVRQIPIPDQYNVVATYPIVTLKTTRQQELAEAFVQFTLSQEGQAILAKYGFGPAPKPASTQALAAIP
jgi:molybdate transport system substrate-binding protein